MDVLVNKYLIDNQNKFDKLIIYFRLKVEGLIIVQMKNL